MNDGENWEQRFARESPITFGIIKGFGNFLWFYVKFQICVLIYSLFNQIF